MMVKECSYIVPILNRAIQYIVAPASLYRSVRFYISKRLLLARPSSLSVPGALDQPWLASHLLVTHSHLHGDVHEGLL
jgi:hypothetical protein